MFISLEKKILFFHISKTAGTSATYFLRNHCPDHEKAYQDIFYANRNHEACKHITVNWKDNYNWDDPDFDPIQHIIPSHAKSFLNLYKKDYSDFFEFIIIRNPYQRFLSKFQYRVTHNPGDDFDWMISGLESEFANSLSEPLKYWFLPQTSYVDDSITKNLKIYRFEELDKLWCDLTDLLQIDRETVKIPLINQNNDKHKYAAVLGLEQKQRIYNMYKSDFIRFGYDREF